MLISGILDMTKNDLNGKTISIDWHYLKKNVSLVDNNLTMLSSP